MIKRPLLLAAMAAAVIMGLLCHFCPDRLRREVPFQEQEPLLLQGRVLQVVKHPETAEVYLVQVLANGRSYGKAVLILSLDETEELSLKAGYSVVSECTFRSFQSARNQGNYNEKSYYLSRGFDLRAEAEKQGLTAVTARQEWSFLENLHQIRERLTQTIYYVVDDPETAGILAAICTGEREGLSQDIRELYQKSGVVHILAISGLHISILGMTLFRLLRKRFRYLPSALICVSFMLCFCVMSSASPSSVRATIMFVIQMTGLCLGKKVDTLCSLSAAFLIMVLFRPLMMLNSGFVLSFLAVLATGTIFESLCAFFGITRMPGYKMKNPLKSPTHKNSGWKRKLAENFLMSLSVTLMLLPVTAFVYYEIPVYSILLNLLIVPLLSLVLGAGFLSAALGLVWMYLGRFLVGAGVYLVWFIRWCCILAGRIPCSTVITGCPEPWRMCCYYGLLFFMYRWFLRSGNRRPSKKPHSLVLRALLLLMMTSVLFLLILAGKTPLNLRISFLDVGQGDGILIENPSGTVYLIDGGSSSIRQVGRYRLEGAVKYYGISRIDYSIVTHPDSDHMNGMMEILKEMPDKGQGFSSGGLTIGTILIPPVFENENYQSLCELASEKGVEVLELHAGMQLRDGQLLLTCLYPNADFTSDDSNAYSAVLDLQYGSFTALFTGDVGEEGEAFLLKENPAFLRSRYSVLKVSHHGSRYSSSEEFLERVRPAVAVISAGEHNSYGHPHPETLQRLKKNGAQIYTTPEHGEIIIEYDSRRSIQKNTVMIE